MDLQRLASLGLLTRTWPADRVLLGTRVCKWLNLELTSHVQDVSIMSLHVDPGDFDFSTTQSDKGAYKGVRAEHIAHTLGKLSKNALTLVFPTSLAASSTLVQGISGAVANGSGSAIVHLDLTLQLGVYPYDYETGAPSGIGPGLVADLCHALARCENLQYLSLRCNKIGVPGAESLARLFQGGSRGEEGSGVRRAGLPVLTHLDLSDNGLMNAGATKLAEGLGECCSLTHLDVGLNKIGADGAIALATALAKCLNLERFETRKNFIESEGARALFEACGSSTKHWNLSDTRTTAEMFSSLPTNQLAITHLDLRRNFLFENPREEFSAFLRRCSYLTFLNLEDCSLVKADARAVGASLSTCPLLTHLSLAANSLRPDWLHSLLLPGALPECTALAHLTLSSNPLSPFPAASSLLSWPELASLSLAQCALTCADILQLAPVLARCSSLTLLNLNHSASGVAGAKALAHAIPLLPKLTELSLQMNGLGAEGIEALSPFLSPSLSPSLRRVELWSNGLAVEEADRLRQRLQEVDLIPSRILLS